MRKQKTLPISFTRWWNCIELCQFLLFFISNNICFNRVKNSRTATAGTHC